MGTVEMGPWGGYITYLGGMPEVTGPWQVRIRESRQMMMSKGIPPSALPVGENTVVVTRERRSDRFHRIWWAWKDAGLPLWPWFLYCYSKGKHEEHSSGKCPYCHHPTNDRGL